MKRWGPCGAYVVVALFALRGMLAGGPFYIHDWGWPLTSAQLRGAIFSNASAWVPNGIGTAAVEPMLHPVFVAWTLLAYIVPPPIVLSITLVAAFVALACGAALACVRLGVRYGIAIPIGAVAMLGPVMLNKLLAGHTYYLISLAAITCELACLLDPRRQARSFVLAGALCALSALQIQLFAVGFGLLLAVALVRREPAFAMKAWGIGIALSLSLPELASLISPPTLASAASYQSTTQWLLNNSALFPAGLVQLGYAPRYAERALASGGGLIVTVALWTIFALALAGLALNWRSARAWLLFLAGAIATMLVLGTNGPLAFMLARAIDGSLFASVFRELYHFAGIAWICEVLLAALALNALPARAGVVGSLLVALALGSLWWSPTLGGTLVAGQPPAAALEAVESVGTRDGDWKFLLIPAEWPLAPSGRDVGGVDPLAYAIGTHANANEYRLSGPLEIAAAFARSGDLRASQRWFEASGVGDIVSEPGMHLSLGQRFPPPRQTPSWLASRLASIAASDAAPVLRPTCILCAYQSLPTVGDPARFDRGDAFLSPPTGMYACRLIPPLSRAADPSIEWTAIAQWQWLDPRFALMDSTAAMTWSGQVLRLDACPSPSIVRAVLLRGTLLLDGRAIASASGVRPLLISPGSHRVEVRDGIAAIEQTGAVSAPLESGKFARADNALGYDWRYANGGGTVAANTAWIVLKTTYSPDWHLAVTGGSVLEHAVVSGYANGWRVHLQKNAAVRVWFVREAPIHGLELVCLIAWIVTIVVLVLETRDRGNRVLR